MGAMKAIRWGIVWVILFMLMGAAQSEAKNYYDGSFVMRQYNLGDYDLKARYFSGGRNWYQVYNAFGADDQIVAGYKYRGWGGWQPIDYVELNDRVISHLHARQSYLFLVLDVGKNKKKFLDMQFKSSLIPRNRKKEGIYVQWALASGPACSQDTPQKAVDRMISRSHIRPWDWAARNAVFVSEDGRIFAFVHGYGSVWDVVDVFHRHKEYYYMMMMDGGSSDLKSARNPLWLTVQKKK